MKVAPSAIHGIVIHGPDSPGFEDALPSLLGRAPRELLNPALPYSVVVENASDRLVSLLGVRFDMLGPKAKQISVVHYADTLRNPSKADMCPGTKRFVCAEPAYTALVIRGEVAANTRGRMNLDNLRRMLSIRASIDCIAFDDGEFQGPDTHGSFARFALERESELELVRIILAMEGERVDRIEQELVAAVQDNENRARRYAARKLLEARAAGREELFTRARNYHCRLPLWRSSDATRP